MESFKQRMIEATIWALWWLMFGSAVAWLLVGSVAYWVKHGWLPPDSDGWVQAFGGIGAIMAAIWVSNAQGRRERLTRLRREYHYMYKAYSTSSFAHISMAVMAGAIAADPADAPALEIYLGQLKQSSVELDQFSYADFVDVQFADAWMLHRRCLQLLVRELDKYLEEANPNLIAGAEALASESGNRLQEMLGALEAHSVRIGDGVWRDHHP